MFKEIDYCTYEMCIMLKELGYKQSSMWYYNTVIEHPEDGGEIEIKQLVKGNRWVDYYSWEKCPDNFLICPTLYDAYVFLCEKFGWNPKPIEKHHDKNGYSYNFVFNSVKFGATTFKNAFKCQIDQAVKYYWTRKFEKYSLA